MTPEGPQCGCEPSCVFVELRGVLVGVMKRQPGGSVFACVRCHV